VLTTRLDMARDSGVRLIAVRAQKQEWAKVLLIGNRPLAPSGVSWSDRVFWLDNDQDRRKGNEDVLWGCSRTLRIIEEGCVETRNQAWNER
jgi:hypothetical protein